MPLFMCWNYAAQSFEQAWCFLKGAEKLVSGAVQCRVNIVNFSPGTCGIY